jgi:hypothetical protein
MLYQSYDALRSGIAGSQPFASKEVVDSANAKSRIAALIWGLMAAFIALVGFWAVFLGPI